MAAERVVPPSPDSVEPADHTPLGRRERKKLQTRQALRTAALRLFAEKGFDHTTIEDITEAADVAPRTFFLHYASKDDVLFGDGRADAARFTAELARQPDDVGPWEAIRRAVLVVADNPTRSTEESLLQARLLEESPALIAKSLEQYTSLEATVAAEVARRTGRDVTDDTAPLLTAACAMTALRVAFTAWIRDGATGDVAGPVNEAFDLLARGMDPASPPRSG